MKTYKLILTAIMLVAFCCQTDSARAVKESVDIINYAYSNWM